MLLAIVFKLLFLTPPARAEVLPEAASPSAIELTVDPVATLGSTGAPVESTAVASTTGKTLLVLNAFFGAVRAPAAFGAMMKYELT